MTLLTVENLTLTLNGIKKLNRLNFTLQAGECVALLGASGSGKSLTARTLLGLSHAGSQVGGRVRFANHDVSFPFGSLQMQNARIAAVFQDTATALHPLICVGKQLVLVLKARNQMTSHRAWNTGLALLAETGFSQPEHIADRYPGELSGGQRQRVCIALALASQSPLLIADEPTTALDVITQAQVLQALKAYTTCSPARSLLLITHDVAIAAALCQRALIMCEGEIVEHGPLRDLLHRPQHPYTSALVAAAQQQRHSIQPDIMPLAG